MAIHHHIPPPSFKNINNNSKQKWIPWNLTWWHLPLPQHQKKAYHSFSHPPFQPLNPNYPPFLLTPKSSQQHYPSTLTTHNLPPHFINNDIICIITTSSSPPISTNTPLCLLLHQQMTHPLGEQQISSPNANLKIPPPLLTAAHHPPIPWTDLSLSAIFFSLKWKLVKYKLVHY